MENVSARYSHDLFIFLVIHEANAATSLIGVCCFPKFLFNYQFLDSSFSFLSLLLVFDFNSDYDDHKNKEDNGGIYPDLYKQMVVQVQDYSIFRIQINFKEEHFPN